MHTLHYIGKRTPFTLQRGRFRDQLINQKSARARGRLVRRLPPSIRGAPSARGARTSSNRFSHQTTATGSGRRQAAIAGASFTRAGKRRTDTGSKKNSQKEAKKNHRREKKKRKKGREKEGRKKITPAPRRLSIVAQRANIVDTAAKRLKCTHKRMVRCALDRRGRGKNE